jgi:hypothetical protein
VSVGIENIADIVADFEEAFKVIPSKSGLSFRTQL